MFPATVLSAFSNLSVLYRREKACPFSTERNGSPGIWIFRINIGDQLNDYNGTRCGAPVVFRIL